MPRPAQPRFPLEPLFSLVDLNRTVTCGQGGEVDMSRFVILAEAIGVDPRTVKRWNVEGIPFWSADVAASRLGRAPYVIWPDWLHVDAEAIPA